MNYKYIQYIVNDYCSIHLHNCMSQYDDHIWLYLRHGVQDYSFTCFQQCQDRSMKQFMAGFFSRVLKYLYHSKTAVTSQGDRTKQTGDIFTKQIPFSQSKIRTTYKWSQWKASKTYCVWQTSLGLSSIQKLKPNHQRTELMNEQLLTKTVWTVFFAFSQRN